MALVSMGEICTKSKNEFDEIGILFRSWYYLGTTQGSVNDLEGSRHLEDGILAERLHESSAGRSPHLDESSLVTWFCLT